MREQITFSLYILRNVCSESLERLKSDLPRHFKHTIEMHVPVVALQPADTDIYHLNVGSFAIQDAKKF